MEPKLKPCPFCGSKPRFRKDINMIHCTNNTKCDAHMEAQDWGGPKKDALAWLVMAWNRRIKR